MQTGPTPLFYLHSALQPYYQVEASNNDGKLLTVRNVYVIQNSWIIHTDWQNTVNVINPSVLDNKYLWLLKLLEF